jgi:hypothetical protein
MEYEDLRKIKDCHIVRELEHILKLNDLCLAVKKEEAQKVCRPLYDVLCRILAKDRPLPNSYFLFQRYCAYLMLYNTLCKVFNPTTTTTTTATVKQARAINLNELESYWKKSDTMCTKEAKEVIKKLVKDHCSFIHQKCYRDTTDDIDDSNRCWICTIDSTLMGVGRPDDVCQNNTKGHSTSFTDTSGYNKTCSHVVLKSHSKYDLYISLK